jgi:hypothetical protein
MGTFCSNGGEGRDQATIGSSVQQYHGDLHNRVFYNRLDCSSRYRNHGSPENLTLGPWFGVTQVLTL